MKAKTGIATVYQITNLINGHRYVGITRFKIEARWTQHKYTAKTKPKTYFHRAIHKYGAENFKIEAVASCIGNPSEAEQQVVLSLEPEYNMTNGGEITVGRRISKEVAEQIRAKNTGLKRTAEQNAAMSLLKKEQHTNLEYREKVLASLEKARANRSAYEEKRLAGLRRAGAEGRMSRVLSAEQVTRQLQNMSTPEAKAKMAESKKKPIKCLTTGKTYPSLIEAAAATGLEISGISKVARGSRNSIYGYRFQYL